MGNKEWVGSTNSWGCQNCVRPWIFARISPSSEENRKKIVIRRTCWALLFRPTDRDNSGRAQTGNHVVWHGIRFQSVSRTNFLPSVVWAKKERFHHLTCERFLCLCLLWPFLVSFFSMRTAEFFVASGFLSFSSAYAKKCVFISELCFLQSYNFNA